MNNRIDVETKQYDIDIAERDASAVIFGFDFQISTALFLFVKYIKKIRNIIVEGKYQDVELEFDDHTLYAQAKSTQVVSNNKRHEKFKEALLSLAKTSLKEQDKYMYISNYAAPIQEKGYYDNVVVKLKTIEDDLIIANKLKNDVVYDLEEQIKTEKDEAKKVKLRLVKRNLNNLSMEELLISSIVPFVDVDDRSDKHKVLLKHIKKLINEDIGIDDYDTDKYVNQTFQKWYLAFYEDGSVKPAMVYKTIEKSSLIWELLVIVSDYRVDIDKLYDSPLNDDLISKLKNFNFDTFIGATPRFKMVTNIVSEYIPYSRVPGASPELFAKQYWRLFDNELLGGVFEDDDIKEYFIKRFIVKVLRNHRNVGNVMNGGILQ